MKKLILAGVIFLSACETKQLTSNTVSNIAANTGNQNITLNGKIFTSFFQQKAAEYRALCYQAFNIARYRLDEYKPVSGKPTAIITDLDETIFDNSPYEVSQTLQGKDYDQASWYQWTAKASADTMPGAATFLKYAASKGVTIFYISNRDSKDQPGTIENLKKFNLPNADAEHLLVKQNTSSKDARRRTVSLTHEIIMLLGDNLADFSSLFDKKTIDERAKNADFAASEFGNRFIILPNAVYGDWESALFNYNYKLTPAQKDSIIKSVLKGY